MELLVNNKIISLDLPVKDVYKKVWVPEHGEGEPMRIVYRMRGLLGDATEDMVNSLDTGGDEDVDNEEVYKMANIMSQCGGLRVMLQRLSSIRDLVSGKQLMTVLLKLFNHCVKVKSNRLELININMNTISIMLGALNLALLAEQEQPSKGQTLTEQILHVMEVILMEASQQTPDKYKEFSKLCGDSDQLTVLLDRINSPFVRANSGVLQALMRLIPFLAFGDTQKMLTLINHFKPYLKYDMYDGEHTQDETVHIDCFCVTCNGIERNANGGRLKDLIVDHGIVQDAVKYIQAHSPAIKTLLSTDSEDWKEFISKPALPYILRLLTGLCNGHEKIQNIVGKDVIPVLHKLENASSDEHIGSMAENLMEALRKNPAVAAKIEDIRQQTKAEKKKLAMAMRQKQLGALGMTTNEKGQVTVNSSVLKQMEDLKEETGLTCCICREGYRNQPTKVLGIYTFTKRVNIEDFENKQRKSQAYSTVSHFNIVHVDCHLAAVRHARVREEWDSAALQNANTKCNGLLPLWGPQVPESAFASCLARHNTYLQECTGVRDASYSYTIHDLKHLILRFGMDRSFSEDSGGGGRESNMHLVPYLIHMALYVMNTTRSVAREEKNIVNFLKAAPDKWIENAYEVEGAVYWCIMGLHVLGREKWNEHRVALLQRLLVQAHSRQVAPSGTTTLTDKQAKDYSIYKPYLYIFAVINILYNTMFKKMTVESGGSWAVSLAEYIRHNDQALQDSAAQALNTLQDEVMPCESFEEFCDVLELLEEISNPATFIIDALAMLP
jgi:E3 ubiquitin-protein ligase UBR4